MERVNTLENNWDPCGFDYTTAVPFHPDEIRKYRNLYYTESWQNARQPPTRPNPVNSGALIRQNTPNDPRSGWKLHRVISGHRGIVHSIAVDPHNAGIDLSSDTNYQSNSSGNLFYTASADCTIKCWDGLMGSCHLTLTGHTAGVRCLATSSEYPYIFSAGEDRDIRVWDLQGSVQRESDGTVRASKLLGTANQTIAKLHGSLGCVYALSAHPRVPFLLASGGSDGAVRVWDIRCNRCVFSFFGHKGTVETICTQPTEPQFISGGSDGTVHTWNLTAGKEDTTGKDRPMHGAYKYHSKSIRASFVHPTEHVFTSVSTDRIQMWKLPSFEGLRSLSGTSRSEIPTLLGETVNAACVANGGEFFVTGHATGALRFHDWKSGGCYLERREQSVSDMQLRLEAREKTSQSSFSEQQRGVLAAVLNKQDNLLLSALRDKTIHLYINPEEH
ncbi:hypothetical protein XU18_1894 [Perkinsela sp. CCAP 1560/4]|nr:hypothetical protein XU18_1894 [Perkinsela sp. CCAP 1560/4]|eukprot:KNH07362.1 hypothetical protein XU18_1894 [Perkinsela sp. CCAP 1560/4]